MYMSCIFLSFYMIGFLVDCGQPEFNSVVSNVSSTTEGATMTFKCDEGLFPSDPITSTCNSTGQWTPDPADVQCRTPGMYILAISLKYRKIIQL